MTKQQFVDSYGKEWARIVSKPAFQAFLQLADEESPLRKSPDKLDGDAVVAGSHFFFQIRGWEGFRKLATTVHLSPENKEETPPDYSETNNEL